MFIPSKEDVRDARYEWFGIKSDEERPSKIERCILNGVEVEYDTKDFVLYKVPPVEIDSDDDDYEVNDEEYDDEEDVEIDENPLHQEFLIYVGDGKNVRNPKGNISCYSMFAGYKGTELDLSNFNTKNVKDMCSMFRECNNLQKLDLSNFDTSSVSNMTDMFFGCKNLREVNLSSFGTEEVESTAGMFFRCGNLQKLDLHNFVLYHICYMNDMFTECCNLKELILPTFVDLGYIKYMKNMFNHCSSLEKLDMSGFFHLEWLKDEVDVLYTYSSVYWEGMFYDCSNLKYIYATDELLKVLHKIKDDRDTLSFSGCGDVKIIDKDAMYESIKNPYVNEAEVYKSFKDAYNISDDDFMNILAEVKPCSPMITLFGKKVLIPKMQEMFDIKGGSSSLTVGEVAKRLYNRYNKVIVDSALVLYLGDQYIVK